MNVDLTPKAHQLIRKNIKLIAMVLYNNFALFMENYEHDFENISHLDSALTYIKPVLVNLKNF